MVVVPAGTFTMGSPIQEAGRYDQEGPQHQVGIQQFAIGKFDLTRGQWSAFLSATKRVYDGWLRLGELIAREPRPQSVLAQS